MISLPIMMSYRLLNLSQSFQFIFITMAFFMPFFWQFRRAFSTTYSRQSLRRQLLQLVNFSTDNPAMPVPHPNSSTYFFQNCYRCRIAYLAKMIPASQILKPSQPCGKRVKLVIFRVLPFQAFNTIRDSVPTRTFFGSTELPILNKNNVEEGIKAQSGD